MSDSEQQEIFGQWLNKHKGLLFKIIRAYAFTAEDRDDLFQDIALQVWRSIPNFRHESAVTTWLYRIALNTALSWKTKENNYNTGRTSIEYPMGILQEDVNAPDEKIAWLYEQIGQLNEIDRSLLLLLLDNLSYKDMADILGITESNVAVKIHRIKKQLATKSKVYSTHEI
jgi:RNA polymerase sigma-70 factor (ECF subfamily)